MRRYRIIGVLNQGLGACPEIKESETPYIRINSRLMCLYRGLWEITCLEFLTILNEDLEAK